ncbi:SOS response-associated peptidase family protein [Pantoea agglomerans]|uniref:SOS response-associated peptidase family protein n=1 Tax=Enterobacter agglomerans TaxID=549 RepID=UPI00289BB6DF|nr:SOS response-associated peptidase family protein [Pantoea agglomerans]WNK56311.1 SOS response-associated peptidase family protein [Pantoea agglomerans]
MPADGWFEWQKEGGDKQPFFIFHKKKEPLFFAAIGRQPYGQDHGKEGFVIVTSASNQGMVDIHDRRPLVITPDAVREWLSEETSPARAEEIAHDAAVPEKAFTWHPVSKKVGNIHHQGSELIEPLPADKD